MKNVCLRISKQFLLLIIVVLTIFGANNSFAAEKSIVGKWQTFNEEGQQTSVVQIWKEGDEFRGKIIKLMNTAKPPKDVVCAACEGDFKDKKLLGMTTLWGLKQDGDEWENGKILVPKQGKVFNCDASLSPDGQQLNLRVYKGSPILGKTRTWVRQPN